MPDYFESGAFAKKPAWHGLGTVLEEGAFTSKEGIVTGKLDWLVEKRPLCMQIDTFDANGIGTEWKKSEMFATVRSDRPDEFLGYVGPDYTVIQNHECFEFMDKLHDRGDIRYESCGSLKGGRVVWMLAKLNDAASDVTPGDTIAPYILLANAHDGTMAIKLQPTAVRVVCWNTLSYALFRENKSRRDLSYSIRHTMNAADRIEAAIDTIKLTLEAHAQYVQDAKRMVDVDLSSEEKLEKVVGPYLKKVFPELAKKNGEVSTKAQNKLESILKRWMQDPTNTIGGQGTAWGLYNATTQYIDHFRTTQSKGSAAKAAETRLNDSWFGQWANKKDTAWAEMRKLVLA